MRNIKFPLAIIFCLLLLCSAEERPVHIFMAGDSTMALKPLTKTVLDSVNGNNVTDVFPERGWGQMLPDFFDDNIVIENFAQNGRSSRTFIEQGWWQKITDKVQPGDYVVIQFAHNDSSEKHPDRYTPPADYVDNLTRFVNDIKSRGAMPIICTSVVRRRFDKNGQFQDSHGEYTELARKVARDNNVPMIDMYEKSKALLVNLGADASVGLFMHVPAGETKVFPTGKVDNTHFRAKGATAMASLFVEGLKELKITGLTNELK